MRNNTTNNSNSNNSAKEGFDLLLSTFRHNTAAPPPLATAATNPVRFSVNSSNSNNNNYRRANNYDEDETEDETEDEDEDDEHEKQQNEMQQQQRNASFSSSIVAPPQRAFTSQPQRQQQVKSPLGNSSSSSSTLDWEGDEDDVVGSNNNGKQNSMSLLASNTEALQARNSFSMLNENTFVLDNAAKNNRQQQPQQQQSAAAAVTKDTRPICPYDKECYRTNPQHFKEMRHPTKFPETDQSPPSHNNRRNNNNNNSHAAAAVPQRTTSNHEIFFDSDKTPDLGLRERGNSMLHLAPRTSVGLHPQPHHHAHHHQQQQHSRSPHHHKGGGAAAAAQSTSSLSQHRRTGGGGGTTPGSGSKPRQRVVNVDEESDFDEDDLLFGPKSQRVQQQPKPQQQKPQQQKQQQQSRRRQQAASSSSSSDEDDSDEWENPDGFLEDRPVVPFPVGPRHWRTRKARQAMQRKLESAFLSRLATDEAFFEAFDPFMAKSFERQVAERRRDMITSPRKFPEYLEIQPIAATTSAASGGQQPQQQQQQPDPLAYSEATGLSLRPYQIDGVNFLLRNFSRGISTLLADDMGLGKTAQTCAFLNCLKERVGLRGPHLVVCPLSTTSSWMRELQRWAPTLTVTMYKGPQAHRQTLQLPGPRVFVVTPATFSSDHKFFMSVVFGIVVFDEAHVLKNDTTAINKYASRLRACGRLGLTGTPVSNTPAELWSMMSFLFPELRKGLARPSDDDDSAASDAADLLKLVMLRRTKGQILRDLPPKVIHPTIPIEPAPVQRMALERILSRAPEVPQRMIRNFVMQCLKLNNHPLMFGVLAMKGQQGGGRASVGTSLLASAGGGGLGETIAKRTRGIKIINERGFDVTPGLTNLLASGAELNEQEVVASSAKMVQLDALLSQILKQKTSNYQHDEQAQQQQNQQNQQQLEQHAMNRVLIFSRFTTMLDILEGFCVLRGYRYCRLDGATLHAERELAMARFNHPTSKLFIFLITTTAGGVGVTLTGANHVVFYDSTYNPQVDKQAMDRAHRIGQTRVVHVHRLCVAGSIEYGVLQKAAAKLKMGDFVIDGIVSEEADAAGNHGNDDDDDDDEDADSDNEHSSSGGHNKYKSAFDKAADAIAKTNSIISAGGAAASSSALSFLKGMSPADIKQMIAGMLPTTASDASMTQLSPSRVGNNKAGGGNSNSAKRRGRTGEVDNDDDNDGGEVAAGGDTKEERFALQLVNRIFEACSDDNGDDGDEGAAGEGTAMMLSAAAASAESSRPNPTELAASVCYGCGEHAHPTRFLHCSSCVKSYHMRESCLLGHAPPRSSNVLWNCPRHKCSECGASENNMVTFCCTRCAWSMCIDCLPARYLSMAGSNDGLTLPRVSDTYAEAQLEGMPVRRTMKYIVCPSCEHEERVQLGLSDDGSDDGDDDEDDDEDA